jgi:lysophospholipase L1-like esterase
MRLPKLILTLLCIYSCLQAAAQPFKEDIDRFKKQDSISMPAPHQILFVGSSSFTNWIDVQSYFPAYPIINRGFGGSSLTDVIRYANDIIFRYHPKQIVIYCGENDMAGDSTVTGKMMFQRFKTLYYQIRKNPDCRNVPIIYIAMKPSPSRWYMKDRVMEGNEWIRRFSLKKNTALKFIDVWPAMLNADGKPLEDIFLEDKLHMNAKGYAIWQKLIEPYLLK